MKQGGEKSRGFFLLYMYVTRITKAYTYNRNLICGKVLVLSENALHDFCLNYRVFKQKQNRTKNIYQKSMIEVSNWLIPCYFKLVGCIHISRILSIA